MEDGARGVLLATKAASGAENAMMLEVYGEAAGVFWQQSAANELRVMRNNEPAEIRTRGLPGLHALSLRGTRLAAGHPEAFIEGFANVYVDFADLVTARRAGVAPDALALHGPDGATGVDGLAFIEACLASSRDGKWVDVRRA
jgi:predicted dehydrogenase